MKMKNVFGICMVAVCCLLMALPAQSQALRFGVKGGVNMSKVTFRNIRNHSTGFYIGPMAELTIPLAGLGVDAAFLYDQRGDDEYKQQAFDIPVNLKWTIGLGSTLSVYLAAGPDFYFDLKKERNQLERRRSQVGVNIGAGVKLMRHLQLGFTYNIPCGDSFTLEDTRLGTKNKTWQLGAAYIF